MPCRPSTRFSELWKLYKKHVASFWTVQEVDLSADLYDWAHHLKAEERLFLTHVLAFFAASDGLVLENINMNFIQEVKIPEAIAFYGFQSAMENIHSEMYSQLVQTYVLDPDERSEVFNALETMPAVRQKAAWASLWMDASRPFAQRLCAFACVEGIMFSGSFCAIFWLKKRGLMKGLSLANQFISRDEGLHCEFACTLYELLGRPVEEELVREIVISAVEAEQAFICEAMPCDLIGLSSKSMQAYIRFVADRLLVLLGYSKFFMDLNPFDWMEMISMQGKTNFFEARVSEYQRAHVLTREEEKGFSLTVDF